MQEMRGLGGNGRHIERKDALGGLGFFDLDGNKIDVFSSLFKMSGKIAGHTKADNCVPFIEYGCVLGFAHGGNSRQKERGQYMINR